MRPAGLKPAEQLVELHPDKHTHGTRLRYMAGCRCLPCRAANARHAAECGERIRAGDGNPLVSSSRARRHLLELRAAGVGYRAAAKAAGVAVSIVCGILAGTRPRCRRQTQLAILGVTPEALALGARVDAAQSWRCVAQLVALGVRRYQIARALGQRGAGLQLGRKEVTRGHELALLAMVKEAKRIKGASR